MLGPALHTIDMEVMSAAMLTECNILIFFKLHMTNRAESVLAKGLALNSGLGAHDLRSLLDLDRRLSDARGHCEPALNDLRYLRVNIRQLPQ